MDSQMPIIIGAAVLCLLCIGDYRQKVTRICNQTAYYFFLVVFLVVNLAVYWILCKYFADSLFKTVTDIASGVLPGATKSVASTGFSASVQTTTFLVPIFVALAYFGLGSSPLQVGNVKLDIYNRLLKMMENILPEKVSVFTDVEKTISECKLQCDQMQRHITNLRNRASGRNRNWNTLDQKWKMVEEQCRHLDRRCTILDEHLAILDSKRREEDKINLLKKKTLKHKKDSQERELDLYKHYVIDFICTNCRDEREIRGELDRMGLLHPEGDNRSINIHYRCLMAGIIVGIILGPITRLIGYSGSASNLMALQGAAAIGISAWIFSFVGRVKLFMAALLVGAVGGYAGKLVFDLLGLLLNSKEVLLLPVMKASVFGCVYGMAVTSLLWIYESFGARRIQSWYNGAVILGLGGAAAFALVFLVDHYYSKSVFWETDDLFGAMMSGFFVAVFLGYGLNLFAKERTSQEIAPQPADEAA